METTIRAPYLYDSKTTPNPHPPHSISEIASSFYRSHSNRTGVSAIVTKNEFLGNVIFSVRLVPHKTREDDDGEGS